MHCQTSGWTLSAHETPDTQKAETRPAVQQINGQAVCDRQRQNLKQMRAKRDESAVRAHLRALVEGTRNDQTNLLALCIDAMSARATVGECMAALAQTWPRQQHTPKFVTEVYDSLRTPCPDWQALCARVETFRHFLGRRPHVLLSKLGQDGHDRGIRLIGFIRVSEFSHSKMASGIRRNHSRNGYSSANGLGSRCRIWARKRCARHDGQASATDRTAACCH